MEKNERQATGLQLSKNSPPEVITNYFRKILELKQTGKKFPVNLNEAWPLAYGRKEDAVRALKTNFIESVHYQVLRRNAENPNGGRPIDEYWLSVACLEYFIASKVHPVFEVYRQVFHATIESKQKRSTSETTKRLQAHYLETPGDKVLREVVDAAVIACGSASRLADRIGISEATFSHIKTRPWLVSDEKLKAIERACRNILARGGAVDTETIEQLMQIKDEAIRMHLFAKMKKGGLI
jgi:DNA-binding transcriptional regulator YdaS (Cro superfamily)